MARGRPLTPLTLTDAENETLRRWIRRRTTAQALALRAQLVLLSAQRVSNQDIAARLHITPQTVSKMERALCAPRSGWALG